MLTVVWVLIAILAALAALAIASLAGRRRFRERVTTEVAGLYSSPGPEIGPSQLSARFDSLPEPVRRYLRYAVTEGAPAIRTVRLKHEGYFRIGPKQRWLPIEGEQHFTVGKPGFVWNACIRQAPPIWIEARDCLLSGKGNMLVKLNSIYTIAEASGPQTDQSASVRWLMEASWFPLGFLGNAIRFEPIDAGSARVSLATAGLAASAVMEVDEEGRLFRWSGERYRDIGGGRAVLTPWIGRCSDYRDFSGFRVPGWVEGSWQLEDGEFAYVRFRVTTLEYNVAERFPGPG